MNKPEFIALLKEPCSITREQTNAVEDILSNYPYFQAARVIHLKGLKKQESFKYNRALKTTAAYTTNRTVLFDLITKDTLNIAKREHIEEKILQESEVVDLEVIEAESGFQVAEKEPIPILESLQIGQPLEFDRSEKHSFNEWLQLTSLQPIERETTTKPTTERAQDKSNTFDIIDEFLRAKPKIKPDGSNDKLDIATASISENEELMTETLARVYLEQKKYEKAIKAFKILSLKYPEKSSFFADRIKAVKFLQKNNT